MIGLAVTPEGAAYIFVLQMLEQFQFSVRPLRQNRCAERLHYLLYSHGLSCKLILGRAMCSLVQISTSPPCNLRTIRAQRLPCPLAADRCICARQSSLPRLCVLLPRCIRSLATNLLVISNVVPKIWARTNSAIVKDDFALARAVEGGRCIRVWGFGGRETTG